MFKGLENEKEAAKKTKKKLKMWYDGIKSGNNRRLENKLFHCGWMGSLI